MNCKNVRNIEVCYGCKACLYTCPSSAIIESFDAEGFFYPRINDNKCIACGKCLQICESQADEVIGTFEPRVLGVKHLNGEVLYNSTSGGVFDLISKSIIDRNGVIYAVALNACFELEYKRIDKYEQVQKCYGSKYVQCEIDKATIDSIINDLSSRCVVFFGTPCQCNGIKKIVGNCTNLILVDFYCHGVPGKYVWKKYIDHLNKNGGLRKYEFRNKRDGWHNSKIRYVIGDKEKYLKIGEDCFSRWFFIKKMFRDSCYKCVYRTQNRVTDITMGDFWGIEEVDKEFDDNRGVSIVSVNSAKGQGLVDLIKEDCIIKEYSKESVPRVNYSKRNQAFITKVYRIIFGIFPNYYTFRIISGFSKYTLLQKVLKGKK